MEQKRPSGKEFEKFVLEFKDFKNKCNKRNKKLGLSKYYLAILNDTVSIEVENKEINAFILLGYFNDLGDCQNAREIFQKQILRFNKYGYFD